MAVGMSFKPCCRWQQTAYAMPQHQHGEQTSLADARNGARGISSALDDPATREGGPSVPPAKAWQGVRAPEHAISTSSAALEAPARQRTRGCTQGRPPGHAGANDPACRGSPCTPGPRPLRAGALSLQVPAAVLRAVFVACTCPGSGTGTRQHAFSSVPSVHAVAAVLLAIFACRVCSFEYCTGALFAARGNQTRPNRY